MTTVAKQFPMTLTEVRAMSINASMPRMRNTGHAGRWNESTVPIRMTKLARGMAATPLLGDHQREDHDQLLSE